MLPALVSGLAFVSIGSGVYFSWRMFIPAYRRFRADSISSTLVSLDEQFLFLTPGEAETLNRLSVAGSIVAASILFYRLEGFWYSLALLIAGYLGYRVPRLAIAHVSRNRLAKIEEQIPDFLKMISGSRRAGQSLPEAMSQCAKKVSPPLSQEIGLILKKIRMGESFEEGVRYLDRRLKLETVSLISSAIILSSESGGSLSPVLNRLENTLEERRRIRRKIDALTAQGRMQGWIVGAIPLLLGIMLFLIDPGLMVPFWTTGAGLAGLAAIFVLEISGFYLIRKIVSEGEV